MCEEDKYRDLVLHLTRSYLRLHDSMLVFMYKFTRRTVALQPHNLGPTLPGAPWRQRRREDGPAVVGNQRVLQLTHA